MVVKLAKTALIQCQESLPQFLDVSIDDRWEVLGSNAAPR